MAELENNGALLFQVSEVIRSNQYLDDILLMVVQLTARLTGSKICSMMLLDEKKDLLTIRATQSLSPTYRNKPPIKVNQSVSGRAVLVRKPVTFLNVSEEPGYRYPEIAKAEGVVSLAAIPMMTKDHVVGVLNCYTEKEHRFSEQELQTLTGVANQAAMAVENTQLLAERIAAFEALEVRKLVDKAKRILIQNNKVSEAAAYKMLQRQSMDRRKSIKEIAEAVILSNDMQL